MVENTVPVIKLQETKVTLDDLMTQYQGQIVGFQLPHQDSVLLLLPDEAYRFVNSAIQARQTLPTRPSKTPAEYFAETVRILRKLEQKYGMSSAKFYHQFQEGILQEEVPVEGLDYWDWRVRYKSFLAMKERFGFSEAEIADG
jgi:hypothetical protein